MSGAVPPLPHNSSHGQIKFTFTLQVREVKVFKIRCFCLFKDALKL
jgi:hypothetical protein